MTFNSQNSIRGGLIYCIGDTIAAFILGEFTFLRMFGMFFIGSTIYTLEIPNYFAWIDKKTKHLEGYRLSFQKTLLAMAYFNPLWIARHLLFIKIISLQWEAINWGLLSIGLISFLVNIPIAFIANFIIQNKIRLDYRFYASAVFSALMAIYYAMSAVWFA